jgi:hypothetical protein
MANDDTHTQVVDFTARGVEFAPWPTLVENDELHLGRITFDVGSPIVTYIQERLAYSLPSVSPEQTYSLEATFISASKGRIFRFGFDPIAFRVLDENGLVELWNASASAPRPAQATFRARGHGWAAESFLVFLGEGDLPRYSYFVATSDLCLEVVCDSEPSVFDVGPAVITEV